MNDAEPAGSRNPFRSGVFTRWWTASLLAGSGVGIQSVTVPLFVRDRVELDDRAFAISAALVAQTLPGAILALVGGVVADRVERRRILVRTYGVATLASAVYVLLSGLAITAVWPVFVLGALIGSAGAFTNPARSSLLPLLVSKSQFQNGVILGTTGFMASFQFLGPMIAGFALRASGLTAAFALEVALLAVAAALFGGIRAAQPPPSGRKALTDLAEGVRYVSGQPVLPALLFLVAIPGIFFIGPFAVTLPLRVPDVFGLSDDWVATLSGCFGGGVVAGSLALTYRPLARRGLAVCISNVGGGLVMLAYSQTASLPLACALLVAWGLNAAVFVNYVVILLQEQADPRMMGRVMSMYSLAFGISMPIGYAQAGAITTRFGTEASLVAGAIGATAVGVLVLLFVTRVRRLR